MIKQSFITSLVVSLALWSSQGLAGEFHMAPFDYLFGNHIDTHQETRLRLDNDLNIVDLRGSLYIIYTGDTDPASGLPVARHPRGASHGEDCNDPEVKCVVGWTIKALPSAAKFLYHAGVNGNDHPVWLLNRVDIPSPGSFVHFHWITTTSTDPRKSTVPEVCDQNNAGQLEKAGAANTTCPGWLIEIHAVKEFAFQHGGELIPISPGIDTASHINLLTNYAVVPVVIDPTR